mmetsp:Transcript_11156/g.25290  ORF Transcript_11156/g.25290 Transcript_11156/m.25290 type:complete len:204 (-) Transcript_11156:51-662(-)
MICSLKATRTLRCCTRRRRSRTCWRPAARRRRNSRRSTRSCGASPCCRPVIVRIAIATRSITLLHPTGLRAQAGNIGTLTMNSTSSQPHPTSMTTLSGCLKTQDRLTRANTYSRRLLLLQRIQRSLSRLSSPTRLPQRLSSPWRRTISLKSCGRTTAAGGRGGRTGGLAGSPSTTSKSSDPQQPPPSSLSSLRPPCPCCGPQG